MSTLPYDKAWTIEPHEEEYEPDDRLWPRLPEVAAGLFITLSIACWAVSLAAMQRWVPVRSWWVQLDHALFDDEMVFRHLHNTVACEMAGLLAGLALGLVGCAMTRRSDWVAGAAVAAVAIVAAGLNAMAAAVILAGWLTSGI